jgi:hypothetical protein
MVLADTLLKKRMLPYRARIQARSMDDSTVGYVTTASSCS